LKLKNFLIYNSRGRGRSRSRRRTIIRHLVFGSNPINFSRALYKSMPLSYYSNKLHNKAFRQLLVNSSLSPNFYYRNSNKVLKYNTNKSLVNLAKLSKLNYYRAGYKLAVPGSFLMFLGINSLFLKKANRGNLIPFLNLFMLSELSNKPFSSTIEANTHKYTLPLNSRVFYNANISYSYFWDESFSNVNSYLAYFAPQNVLLDTTFIKFFSKRSNLLRSSRRLSIPKIMRKAIITGSKLSVDTYALNYFSYKVFLPMQSSSSLFRYSSSLSVKDSLRDICRLPLSSSYLPFSRAFVTQNNFSKLFTKLMKRKHYKLYSTIRKLVTTNYNKKTLLLNRLFRKKKSNKNYFRHLINNLYDLNVYPSRFVNPSNLIIKDRFNARLPKPSIVSSTMYKTNHKTTFNFTNSSLFNKFFHQTITQLLLSPSLIKLNLLNRAGNTKPLLDIFSIHNRDYNNLLPVPDFKKNLTKKIKKYVTSSILRLNITPWYHNTIIRFFEHCSGNKVFLQYYLSIANHVDSESIILYKR